MNVKKFINEINYYYENVLKMDIVNDFEVPYTTMNIGMINGGETVNSVPGKCSITIDFRIAKESHLETILNEIRRLLKNTIQNY